MKLPVLGMAVVLLAGPVVAVADKLDDTFQNLKDAVAQKDAAQVKKLVAELDPLVQEAMARSHSRGCRREEGLGQSRHLCQVGGRIC